MVQDLVGRDVEIGDYVVFSRRAVTNLILGRVIRTTEKNVIVERVRSLDDGTFYLRAEATIMSVSGSFMLAEPLDERDIVEQYDPNRL